MSYEIKSLRLHADAGVRFNEELEMMDEALYAAYRRGATDFAEIIIREAEKIFNDEGVNPLDLKLGCLLFDTLADIRAGTKQ